MLMRARGGRRRGGVGALGVALALAAGALGGGCGGGAGGSAPTSAAPDVGLSGPGTPLAAGLVAPRGTVLVGPVFAQAGQGAQPGSKLVVLRVDRDPLAAWDDLADQAAAQGIQLTHSGACQWSGDEVAAVGDPRPAGAFALQCMDSGATTRATVEAELWSSAHGAEMTIDFHPGQPPAPPGGELVDPGRAPASAAGQVPHLDRDPIPATGAPFGQETNCFLAGYRKFRVPPGATVVGGGTTPIHLGFGAVLAVRDAHRVLEELARQAVPAGTPQDRAMVTIDRVVAAGRPVWHLAIDIQEGGGGCAAWANPEGNAIVLTAHSD